MSTKPVVTARLRRAAPVFVCKKCLGRIPDGKALRKKLKSELKSRSATLDCKAPRVVLSGCLGICPKRAVVVASSATLQHGEYLLVSEADAAAEAAEKLMPGQTR